jgi:hypothetical protein
VTDSAITAELDEIGIGETSGVDHPATEIEGWMMMKNRGEISKAGLGLNGEAGEGGGCAALMSSMEAEVTGCLAEAPDEVKQAAEDLYAYLETVAAAAPPAATDPTQPAKDPAAAGPVPPALQKGFFAKITDRLHRASVHKTLEQELDELLAAPPSDRGAALGAVAALVHKMKENGDMAEDFDQEKFAKDLGMAIVEAEAARKPAEEVASTAGTETEALAKAADVAAIGDQLKEEREAHEATREALSKALDRIGNLEKRSVVRTSSDGEEKVTVQKSHSGGVFGGVVDRAMRGERVEMGA